MSILQASNNRHDVPTKIVIRKMFSLRLWSKYFSLFAKFIKLIHSLCAPPSIGKITSAVIYINMPVLELFRNSVTRAVPHPLFQSFRNGILIASEKSSHYDILPDGDIES